MSLLQDYLIYPARLSLQLDPAPFYSVAIRTRQEDIFTRGTSFANALKMSTAVLIDMGNAQALEDNIPTVGVFKQQATLVSNLKTWLKNYTTGLEESAPFEATYLKYSYLAQIVNLFALSRLESEAAIQQTDAALQLVLKLPLAACPQHITPEQLPKPLTKAKANSVLYLLARLFEMAPQDSNPETAQAIQFLSKIANKRTCMPLNPKKFKEIVTKQQDEIAVLLPLHTALKFMLCDAILEHRVKLRTLADDLHCSKEHLEEELNLYKESKLSDLMIIFNRLGLSPEFYF